MSFPGDPGYRPTPWGTAGDHDKRIRHLEALVSASGAGCGLPCPPWTVDYDTGEVTGTTYDVADAYPVPLTLEIVDPDNIGGPVYWGAASPLVTDAHGGDFSSVIGAAFHAQVDATGTAVGTLVQTEQTGGGTSFGIIVEVSDTGFATMDGVFVTVAGETGSITGVRSVASASDPTGATVTAGDFTASGGDVNWAGYFRSGNVNIQNTLFVSEIGDYLTVQLVPGLSMQVRDSSFATIFEVREDGTVHILTGTAVLADL